MIARIQLRNDTASAWSIANPTLAQGEMGIESDTLKQKVGDGTTAWNALGYSAQPTTDADLQTLEKTITGAINEVNSDLSDHIADISNPHSVTATQVGLGNVDNTSDITKMTVSTFSGLNTTDKTIVGAINKLDSTKQDSLVSGSNIKTVNGESLLGGGNLVVAGGGDRIYNTIQEAVALTDLQENQLIETDGFYTKGDKGAWKYQVTTLVNGGYNISTSTTGLYLSPILTEGLSPLHFGAKTDGSQDDTNRVAVFHRLCVANDLEFYIPKGILHNFNQDGITPYKTARLGKHKTPTPQKIKYNTKNNILCFGDSITFGADETQYPWGDYGLGGYAGNTTISTSYSNNFMHLLDLKLFGEEKKDSLTDNESWTGLSYITNATAVKYFFGLEAGIKFGYVAQNNIATLKSRKNKLSIYCLVSSSGSTAINIDVSYDGGTTWVVNNEYKGVKINGSYPTSINLNSTDTYIRRYELDKNFNDIIIRFIPTTTGNFFVMTNFFENKNSLVVSLNSNIYKKYIFGYGLPEGTFNSSNNANKIIAYNNSKKPCKNISINYLAVNNSPFTFQILFKMRNSSVWQNATQAGLTFYSSVQTREENVDQTLTHAGETSSNVSRVYFKSNDPTATLDVEAVMLERLTGDTNTLTINLNGIRFNSNFKYNKGISGHRLHQFISQNWNTEKSLISPSDLVIFNFGMNEWITQESVGKNEWINLWKGMLKEAIDVHGANVVLICPSKAWFQIADPTKTDSRARNFISIVEDVRRVAEDLGCYCIDWYDFMISQDYRSHISADDDIHPTKLGHMEFAKRMINVTEIED